MKRLGLNVGPGIRVNSRGDRGEVGKLVLVNECAASGFNLRLGWMLGCLDCLHTCTFKNKQLIERTNSTPSCIEVIG